MSDDDMKMFVKLYTDKDAPPASGTPFDMGTIMFAVIIGENENGEVVLRIPLGGD